MRIALVLSSNIGPLLPLAFLLVEVGTGEAVHLMASVPHPQVGCVAWRFLLEKWALQPIETCLTVQLERDA